MVVGPWAAAPSWEQPLVSRLGGALCGLRIGALAQRKPELGARRIAIVGVFRQYAIDDAVDAFGQLGAYQSHRRVRFGRDFLHEPWHRFGAEGQLSAQQLIETHPQCELVGTSIQSATFELFRRHE